MATKKVNVAKLQDYDRIRARDRAAFELAEREGISFPDALRKVLDAEEKKRLR